MSKDFETENELKCNIDPDLFQLIQVMRRTGDVETLCAATGMSRPTITKALKYGHVKDAALDKALITLYKQRAQEQRDAVKEIVKNLK